MIIRLVISIFNVLGRFFARDTNENWHGVRKFIRKCILSFFINSLTWLISTSSSVYYHNMTLIDIRQLRYLIIFHNCIYLKDGVSLPVSVYNRDLISVFENLCFTRRSIFL